VSRQDYPRQYYTQKDIIILKRTRRGTMTASIYYIATSNYKQGFEQFRTDLHYFLPDVQKTVVVLSDGLTEWDNVEENGILYKVYKIKHYCWPIITLFKMQYMLDYKMDTDLVFFVNADLQYNKDYTG